ncbi:class I SAM-dependent methyltransferase [Domibacillus epiphyticus]|uniref:class I SAM-dependent methyltransferase n=1 Tax=Domibacillus epiphyticus TaxID=1714355 RepID=UPI001300CEBD|nr:class I SAM-dependent methyltransferase [Domibacillus epiphyticus]
MKEETYKRSFFEEQWQERMKDWEGNLPERMVDDTCEEHFWRCFIERKQGDAKPDAYSQDIMRAIVPFIHAEDQLLEIGPGSGNYTFSLAERAESLTVVDSSEAVLTFLKTTSEEKKLKNLHMFHGKWENFSSDKSYDVIFGMNCFYRMFEIKQALRLMNQYAKRLVILGMTTGPIKPHYVYLHQKYQYEMKWPRRDYIDLLNLLYELGIYAECRMIPLKKTYRFSSFEELLNKSTSKVLSPNVRQEHLKESLEPYVYCDNGSYFYDHKFHAAIITWTPSPLFY